MAQKVAYECVQLHGGYGYMREYPIERFFRDIRLMTIGGGTSEIMKEIIAKQMAI
jgi:acyl-CoA dehydrogenase